MSNRAEAQNARTISSEPVRPDRLFYVSGWSNLSELAQLHAVMHHIVDRDGARACFYCGVALGGPFQLDHVTPKQRGGSHHVDNLVLACKACNTEKSTWPAWIFVLRDLGLPARIRELRLERRRAERSAA